jgi:hypothetical protein
LFGIEPNSKKIAAKKKVGRLFQAPDTIFRSKLFPKNYPRFATTFFAGAFTGATAAGFAGVVVFAAPAVADRPEAAGVPASGAEFNEVDDEEVLVVVAGISGSIGVIADVGSGIGLATAAVMKASTPVAGLSGNLTEYKLLIFSY